MNGCKKVNSNFMKKLLKLPFCLVSLLVFLRRNIKFQRHESRKFNSNFVCGQTWIIVKVCVSRNLDFVARRTIDCSNSLFVSFFPPFSPKWGKAWGGQCAHILEMERNKQAVNKLRYLLIPYMVMVMIRHYTNSLVNATFGSGEKSC